MQVPFSRLTPAIFISLGNARASCCNLRGIFWFLWLGLCGRGTESERPNRNTQERCPHHSLLKQLMPPLFGFCGLHIILAKVMACWQDAPS